MRAQSLQSFEYSKSLAQSETTGGRSFRLKVLDWVRAMLALHRLRKARRRELAVENYLLRHEERDWGRPNARRAEGSSYWIQPPQL